MKSHKTFAYPADINYNFYRIIEIILFESNTTKEEHI